MRLTSLSGWAVAVVCVFFASGTARVARAGEIPAVITTAMAVRDLAPAEAAKEHSVRIQGVVTYVNVLSDELFVQDETAGIYVFIRYSESDMPLVAGQLVEVTGVTAPGDFSSSITKAVIRVLGAGPMPKARKLAFERVLGGEEDSQWGELKGVVLSGRVDEGVLYLNAVTSGGAFLVVMKEWPADWASRWIDAKVTFEGVLAAAFNEHRQVVGVRIFIPSPRYVHIDDPAPASPFDLPQSSVGSIGAFRTNRDWSRRVRVRATVTAAVSKSLAYVSDGEGNLPVELNTSCTLEPGDLLDIVGFPGVLEGRPGLKNGICRRLAQHKDVSPLRTLARDILPLPAREAGSGLSIAAGTRHDLRLVQLDGTLVQFARGLHSQTLTLAALDQNFTVTVPDAVPDLGDTLKLGSRLSVSGVCLITYDEYRRAESFRILIRRATDIVVQSSPPWWTLEHAIWIIGAMLLSVLAALGWISVLHTHVATKTRELREANERLRRAAVEDALTGAANRRRFDEMLAAEVSRSVQKSLPISLVIIDIDHFKAMNDVYGHQTGDECLSRVVGALRKVVSGLPEDSVARYGGEEFAVILPDTDESAAMKLANSMRQAVEQLEIPHTASPTSARLSISLGVGTLWPEPRFAPAHLIGVADRALYQAKEGGRNRVVCLSSGGLTGMRNMGSEAEPGIMEVSAPCRS